MAEEKQTSKMKFQVLAEGFFKLKWLTADETDDTKLQYEEFVDSKCSKRKKKISSFDKSTDAVPVSWRVSPQKSKVHQFLDGLWQYLCFCHGQSAIEGFSDNKQLLVEDLQEKSLVSKQAVYDLSAQRKLKFKSMIVQVIFSEL